MSALAKLSETLDPKTLQELKEILAHAEEGDQAYLPALRSVLDRHPEIGAYYGNLSAQVQEAWKNMIAGPNLLLHESVGRKLEALRVELSGDNPTPLEKLMVERILACWLQVEHADAIIAETTSATHAQHATLQKRLNAAQHRYLSAIRQLATLRKLVRPALSPLQLVTATLNEGPVTSRRRSSSRAGVSLSVS